ncbi:MAG: GGDEF domain-containing protein [Lachnospiraceae bacterium]|nr:GGDEF domain-containing protein [Lachnospiraceae bacterium]
MTDRRKKQLQRIKKAHIWPSLVGIIIKITVMAFIMHILLLAYFENIVNMRLADANNTVRNAVDVMEATGNADSMSLLFRYRYLTGMIPEIEGMCRLDKDNNVEESFGTERFDLASFARFNTIKDDDMTAEVYIAKNQDGISFSENEGFTIDVNETIGKYLVSFNPSTLIDVMSPSAGWNKEAIFSTDLWYVIDNKQTDGKTAIMYRFSLTREDFGYVIFVYGLLMLVFLVLLVFHSISVFKVVAAKRNIYKILFFDMETGGFNAPHFYKKARKLYRRIKRGISQYAIVNIRLEKYRSLIACYGKSAIETLTDMLYNIISQNAGSKEAFAHMDSGDFAMMLEFASEQELGERLKQLMQQLESVGNGSRLYFNMGVSRVTDAKGDPEEVYNQAYLARSVINDENADSINWFSEKLREQQIWERKVENDMQGALERHEFQMYLQPKYTTNGEKVGGAEALVRWIHPTEGFVPPGKFIPIFEKNGFILQLDDYMINEVARYQAKWISEGKKVVPISVNVSRAHFLNDNLAEHIRNIIDSYCVPHDCIELELTESAFFDDKNALIATVKKMQEFGFVVSMDDFGAGYSSLNSLKELPLDVIKLDAEFFRGEGNDERGKLIVTETIDLAKRLGMHIVAEGIETREQVDFLKERECDLIQGFYFAKPMPTDEFEKCAFS